MHSIRFFSVFSILVVTLSIWLLASGAQAGTSLDSPHNETNAYSCDSCHDVNSGNTMLMPDWTPPSPQTIDDTICNGLCVSCHNDDIAPSVKTHSSLQTSKRYGDWTVECWVCHSQHKQDQLRTYGAASYVYSGSSDSVTESTLTRSGAGWDSDQFKGMLLVPNTANPFYNYTIESNTSDQLTVNGPVDLGLVTAGDPFAITYGKLPRKSINLEWITDPLNPKTDPSTTKDDRINVRFFGKTGQNSFADDDADGDGIRDGICEVCHTETTHFRNDGSGSDQTHDNVGGAAGKDCMECHDHRNGFAHGGGSGAGCIECHGHDAGTVYGETPNSLIPSNSGGATSMGAGTFQSHSTHTELDTDDLKGPGIYCSTCHNINKFPLFRSVDDPDEVLSLADTDVCDECHSQGGSYDGINDPAVGAKRIWRTGAYVSTDDSTLRDDKQKWCAGCHDHEPSVIQSINAPNVIGNEDEAYTYGTGWGYYKTGHGLVAEETYPSKGGLETLAGRPINCDSCHDFSTAHIDGAERTFNCSDGCDPAEYRQSYRLSLVDGSEPMEIPWTGTNNANSSEKYRLCVKCHDAGPYTDSLNSNTNMYTWSDGRPDWSNRHASHLSFANNRYQADYDYTSAVSTKINCVICHNVHGSTRMAMVRDGKLINREPGLRIWNYNPSISTDTVPPVPEDLPLSLSTAARWHPNSSSNICSHCHFWPSETSNRVPFQGSAQWTQLDWTGEYSYTNDGAYPDSAVPGSMFTFRVEYASTDTNPPAVIQLWIDMNDNGSYESGEKFDLEEVDRIDTVYFNGKLYSINLQVNSAGDDTIQYRFYAEDSSAVAATGSPTGDSTISLLGGNRPPELAWVADACRYQGVSPAAEVSGSDFVFYVNYSDADGECPPAASDIQVIVGGIPYDLTEVDSGDANCVDGKAYSKTLTLSDPGNIQYSFTASDGNTSASGVPTNNHTVNVIDTALSPVTVCDPGCDFTTIQGAVDGATDDQIILVYEGTYEEQVYFDTNDDNTIVRSACGPEYTTIDVSSIVDTYGVQVSASTGSVVDGFQITGGTTGVYVAHSSAPTNIALEDCDIHNNTNTAGSGGGVYVWRAHITIDDSKIRNNTATANGGGIYSFQSGSTVTVSDSILQQNEAGYGGGYYSGDGSGTAIFDTSVILGNTASENGGGVYAWEPVNLYNTVVAANTAEVSGGAVYVRGGTTFANNCTFADNEARTGQGGAFYNWIANIIVKNSILWNNFAPATLSGHINFSHSTSTVTVSDSVISNDGDDDYVNSPYFDKDDGTITATGFTDERNPFFVDDYSLDVTLRDYHILHPISSAIDNANAGDPDPPLDSDIDGDSRPQGSGHDIGADEYLDVSGNNAPVLAWTGETGFVDDGVEPNDGDVNTMFVFRVDYYDSDNDPPSFIQLWLDENDDGVYGETEKHAFTAVDGDADYTDGKRYAASRNISYAGDGTLSYRFFATDETEQASGLPTSNMSVRLTNSIPSLAWTGETNYVSDGVDPDSATGGATFTFRVNYTDLDGKVPDAVQIWIDENDNSTYEGDEKYSMTLAGGGDGDFANGEIYTHNLDIFFDGDGILNYRFYAKDSKDEAAGDPASDQTVVVENSGNNSPVLSWTGEPNYIDNGVDPESDEDGSNTFTFRVTYSDSDNNAPAALQLWIDLNDDGDFNDTVDSITEKQDLSCSGTDYVSGEICSISLTDLSHAGDGFLSYRFYANDGQAVATGDPAGSLSFINVYHLLTVNCGSIQDSINTAVDGDLILVGDCTYNENITYLGKKITVRSVNGPASTIIAGDGTNAPVVTFMSGEPDAAVLDGFTIDNQAAADTATRGIQISSNAEPTIRNCVIVGNKVTASYVDGAGIYIFNGAATIESTTIGGDIANQNDCDVGCGVYAESITGPLSIRDSVISWQLQGRIGSGVYLTNNGTQVTNITNTTISNNTSERDGGGIAANESKIVISGSTISSNEAASTGTHGGAILIAGAGSSATIVDTDFDANSAVGNGGAIAINDSTEPIPLTITDSTFTNNFSVSANGGAIYLENLENESVLTNVTVSGNIAQRDGGGIAVVGSKITVSGLILDSNSTLNAGTHGGGLYVGGNASSATVTNTDFNGNSAAGNGGAIYVSGSTQPAPLTVTGGTISGNTAPAANGGAIYFDNITNEAVLSKVTIKGNSALQRGGALYIASSASAQLNNCIISGNVVGNNDANNWEEGGGIRNYGTVNLYSSTVAGNHADGPGGGMDTTGTATVHNSIFWDNNKLTASGSAEIDGAATVTYSDVDESGYEAPNAGNNIRVNPAFIGPDPATAGTPKNTGNYHLLGGSGVLEQGTLTDAPPDDIDNDIRPQGAAVDMGADEYVY